MVLLAKRFHSKPFRKQYVPGNVGIILSVPHGGWLEHPEIADRTDAALMNLMNNNNNNYATAATNKIRTTADGWTIDLGAEIFKTVMDELPGQKVPHLVVCKLKRSKVDVNRDIVEGAQENPIAKATHKAYHAFIREAKSVSERGIIFDIHGQSHGQNKAEIGYLLTKDVLNSGVRDASKSSIKRLHQEKCNLATKEPPSDLDDLIAGPQSFGAMLESQGYPAFPSPRQPCPGKDKYYYGGFITRCHGSAHSTAGYAESHTHHELTPASRLCPVFDAIQLETPRESRMDGGEEEMRRFGKAIGRAIAIYFVTHYRGLLL